MHHTQKSDDMKKKKTTTTTAASDLIQEAFISAVRDKICCECLWQTHRHTHAQRGAPYKEENAQEPGKLSHGLLKLTQTQSSPSVQLICRNELYIGSPGQRDKHPHRHTHTRTHETAHSLPSSPRTERLSSARPGSSWG